MSTIDHFVKDNGKKLPVSDDFLLPFLNPTSPGTRYWEPPPAHDKEVVRRQDGRVMLQLHQLIDLVRRTGVDLAGKAMLDIGTGNGMIPRLMLQYTGLERAVGIDPYLDGEHMTSWIAHDRDEFFRELVAIVDERCAGTLDFDRYADLTSEQDMALRPAPFPYGKPGPKQFRFQQIGAHEIDRLDDEFDLFYAKAIDHIPDWEGIFRAMKPVASANALIVIKHFSFFSYLGPHRYATTNIPWGHLLLTDDEYRRFAREFHAERADKMVDFYFRGLAYPRTTMSQLTDIARRHGFLLTASIVEPNKSLAKFHHLIDAVEDFWPMVRTNHPSVSVEEMLSGRCHIVFRYAG